MIDILIDDVHLNKIANVPEGFRLDFENKEKDEFCHLVLNKENLIELFNKVKIRVETL